MSRLLARHSAWLVPLALLITAVAHGQAVNPKAKPTTEFFKQGGNAFGATAVLGTTDTFPLEIYVANKRALRIEPTAATPNVIGGNPANSVAEGVSGATIAGGGVEAGCTFAPSCENRVLGLFGTIGGGSGNTAYVDGTVAGGILNTASSGGTVGGGYQHTTSADWATISGGFHNTASGTFSTVGGGADNTASGSFSTVGGGADNIASGENSAVAGGEFNAARGRYSFAAGFGAQALHDGTFVFADFPTNFGFYSVAPNEFAVRATGGVRFVTAIDGTGAPTWVCGVSGGSGGSWGCSSDRNLKAGLVSLDGVATLERLATLPVYRWFAKDDARKIPHAGPMAQDFMAAFGLGDNERMIGFADAQGIAFAAIQGLHQLALEKDAKIEAQQRKLQEQDEELASQRRIVTDYQRRLAGLETRMAEVELLRGEFAALRATLAAKHDTATPSLVASTAFAP